MRACCVFLCLLAATFALSVKSKPHGKHHKTLNVAKDKDIIAEEANEPQALPTLLPLEESGTEQEVEDLSSEDNANANKEIRGIKMPKSSSKTEAVLMSDEELTELLKKEEQEVEERELEEEEEAEVEEGKEQSVEISEDSEKMSNDQLDREDAEEGIEGGEEIIDEDEEDAEEGTDEDGEDAEMLDKEEIDVEMMPLESNVEKAAQQVAQTDEQGALFEESDGSAESEIPADLDYAADSGLLQALHTLTPAKHPNSQLLPETEGNEQKTSEEEVPAASDDSAEAADGGEMSEHDEDQQATSKDEQGQELDGVTPDPKESADVPMSKLGGKEEEKSRRHSKRKTKKQQRNHMVGKHFPQSEQPQSGQEQSQQESESSSAENTGSKAKRRRAGKWGSIVGMNPVQIRATVDLYPSTRSALAGHVHHPEAPADPCTNFPCKRGKMCKLDADNKPGCVCQQASECPPSVNDFDSVCGTDNKTYDSSCQLFAAKCNLEGTKRGHRLHLDYTGPCKLIPSCLDAELVQFPLRMRDWLKNVLLQLYEHDSATPGFLTAKQRFKVKKIFESERRLHAGNHSAELLAQDFEKNYNMYIYPVHWQFAQLDQHPSDRFLSHSELAPLRVPLVPMEHCTSRFFQECDADKDKQVSFKEWTSCFGIRNEDMDVNQLF